MTVAGRRRADRLKGRLSQVAKTEGESLVERFLGGDSKVPGHMDLHRAVIKRFGSADGFAELIHDILQDPEVPGRDKAKILLSLLVDSRHVEAQQPKADPTTLDDDELEEQIREGFEVLASELEDEDSDE